MKSQESTSAEESARKDSNHIDSINMIRTDFHQKKKNVEDEERVCQRRPVQNTSERKGLDHPQKIKLSGL